MSVSTKARDYMSIYLLDPKSFDLETWPSNRYSYGEILHEETFLRGEGSLRRSDFDDSNLCQS